ncbi:MAG TPA: efflux transporter outer membrane subunit [Motiliproteus sp.]
MTGHRTLSLCFPLLLSGCAGWSPVAVTPLPEPALVEQWQQAASSGVEVSAGPQPWLQRFADPELDELVAVALRANPLLTQARARLREGEAQAQVVGAPSQLQLDAGLQAGRTRRNTISSNSFTADLSLSWEPDLWGRLSAAAQAAVVDRAALREELRDAQLSLAANLAKAWFAAAEAEQQRRLSQQLVDNLSQSLQVLEEGYQRGIVAALDIHLARANLASEQGRLAERQRALSDRVRALELLLGRYPARELTIPSQLPPLPGAVPLGLPSELLTRRPDIRAASARLQSAELRQRAAHKDRFPRFSLTASLGGSSSELGRLLNQQNLFWTLFGNLSQPLLDGGRLQGLELQAAARWEQAQAQYVDTLLQAFAEVEGALEQERALSQLNASLTVSVEESDLAEALAFEQYRQGLVDIVTVLEAQRRAFSARSTHIEARNRQLQNRIDLYLALGGDFAATAPTESRHGNNDHDQS